MRPSGAETSNASHAGFQARQAMRSVVVVVGVDFPAIPTGDRSVPCAPGRGGRERGSVRHTGAPNTVISDENLRMMWALAYPFPRPRESFVFVDGHTLMLTGTEGPFGQWRARYRGQDAPVRELVGEERAKVFERGDYHAVVAVGSNAAPVQLRRKFARHLDGVVIPVVKITIPGHIIAWGKHIAPYGAIGATIAEHEGASVQAWATLLGPDEFDVMNETEAIGETYDHHRVTVTGAPEAVTSEMVSYRSLAGHMPLLVEGYGHQNPPHPYGGAFESQEMAIRALNLHMSVDQFIAENVGNPELARERDRMLASVASFD